MSARSWQFPEQLQIVQPQEEDKVYFRCSEHNYWASLTPPLAVGCHACWCAFFMLFYGKYHDREGEVDVAEKVFRKAAEAAEKGQWDYKMFRRPEITREEPS